MEKILIVVEQNLSPDSYIAAYTLANSYSSSGHEVQLITNGELPSSYTSNLSLEGNRMLDALPPQKFLIQFPAQDAKIQNIQWNQTDKNVNFYITMEKGKFNAQDLNFQPMGAEFKNVILVNLSSLSNLGTVYSPETAYAFEGGNLIAIGNKPADAPATIKVEKDNEATTISEHVLAYIQKNNLKLDANIATFILAGIYTGTENFSKAMDNPHTFITSAELIKKGAETVRAAEIANKFLSAAQPN